MTIYLYLKTHNKTGLMYLGKTVKDPFKYHGSGKRWKNHLKVHGKYITTEILFQTEDNPNAEDSPAGRWPSGGVGALED